MFSLQFIHNTLTILIDDFLKTRLIHMNLLTVGVSIHTYTPTFTMYSIVLHYYCDNNRHGIEQENLIGTTTANFGD